MAYSVESNARTPITHLRESLDKAERLIVQVDSSTVGELLTLLDGIDEQFEQLDETESDIRSEHTRWEGLLHRINNRPDTIVRAARVAGGMDKLRAAHPPAESFWWHLDAEVTRRRVTSIRSTITVLVTIVVLTVGGYWAINFFFPPDPEAVMMVETNSGLDRLIAEQRWPEALELVQNARANFPANAELMVWEVVINEQLGNLEAAAAAAAEAEQALAAEPLQYLLYLGNNRLRAGNMEGAQAAATKALELDPNEPQIYFLLGSVAETEGDIGMAISYFNQTAELAEGTNPQLSVIAKVRMGNLLQSPGSVSTSEVITPTVP